MIGRFIHKLRFGKSRVIEGVYKLNFDEFCDRDKEMSYGLNDITDKGVVVRLGNRCILLNEDEVYQMFIVTHMLLAEGVEYDR